MNRKACPTAFLAVLMALTLNEEVSAQSSAYTWTTFAGYPGVGSADGIGSAAQFNGASGVAVDTNGNAFVADSYNLTIRKITPAGVVSTFAGMAGLRGTNDGVGSLARFQYPWGIAVDGAGFLYVTDGYLAAGVTIRRITPAGNVSTIAGSAANPGNADGTNSAARFNRAGGIAVDRAGSLYVSDYWVDPSFPFDPAYITIRKVTPVESDWVVSTIAHLQRGRYEGGSGYGVAVDNNTNVYVANTGTETIAKLTPTSTNWVVSIVAGSGVIGSNNGVGTNASFSSPLGISLDTAGYLYVTDQGNHSIRTITPSGMDWIVSTLAGSQLGSGDGTGTNAQFSGPGGIAADSLSNLYVTDGNLIRKVTSAGVVWTIAGAAATGSVDGTGGAARFSGPWGVAVDGSGTVYVADAGNKTIREITSAELSSTIAGTAGLGGTNDGVGSFARFQNLSGIAVDSMGNMFVVDDPNPPNFRGGGMVRKITLAGVVSTIAGGPTPGTNDGVGASAQFYAPGGIAIGTNGDLYVADAGNNMIRRIKTLGTNWVVSTFAGSAISGTNDGIGTAAQFEYPSSVAVDHSGNVFVADSYNSTIRMITPAGVVSTIAGQAGNAGSTDGVGAHAQFFLPSGVAVDILGNIYVTDLDNFTIRKMTLVGTNWLVSTIGGLSANSGSADGPGSMARFDFAEGIAVDNAGNLYVADTGNNTIRKGVFTDYTPTNPAPFVQPAMKGSLQVFLQPNGSLASGAKWRFAWEVGWHNSGETVTNLGGNYPVEFRVVSGWAPVPASVMVPVPANGPPASFTNYYVVTNNYVGGTNMGSLTVNIGPSPPAGAGWHFAGDTVPSFPPGFPPGYNSTNLPPGTYLVEFAPVSNYATPANLSVQVVAGESNVISVSYLLARGKPGGVLLPTPVPISNITNVTSYPFGFNGQLVTGVGHGSGVVVEPHVVLTAAHLVFDDQSLSYVSQAYWFLQNETGVFVPDPLPARAAYVLSDYAGQRISDLLSGLYGPNQSTPQSRNLDVAALYFLDYVGGPRGGYGGYLPSDTVPSSWLTGTSLKMLVGYPVDGSLFGDSSITNGIMYQTDPQPYPLSLATDPNVANQQVYLAPWFLSYSGNSGGPLYVQYNGYYYPAGVYSGTLYSGSVPYASVVRAIDSAVVDLITLAGNQPFTGTNNPSGGVITLGPTSSSGLQDFDPLQSVVILGPSRVPEGGSAQYTGQATFTSGYTISFTQTVWTSSSFAITNGLFTAGTVTSNTSVTLSAAYTNSGYLHLVTTNVTVLPLEFTIPKLLANNLLSFTLTNGIPGKGNVIQTTTNLTCAGCWMNLLTNVFPANGTITTNVPWTNSRGFFRAQEFP